MVGFEMKFKGTILVDTPGALQIFREEYLRAFKNSLETLRDMIKVRTPIGASGALSHSIAYRARDLTPTGPFGFPTAPPEFEGVVYARSETEYLWGLFPTAYYEKTTYAEAVERGTTPHFPPLLPLRDWASRVLGLARPEASMAAYFIGRKISKVGTQGRFMFRDGLAQFTAEGVFEKNIEEAAALAMKKIMVETPWWAAF